MIHIFIIGIIQDSLNSTMFRNSMLYEKYNYLQSLCVPQGKNTTTNEEICSQNDYNNVLRLFSEFAKLYIYHINCYIFSIIDILALL